MKIFYLRSLENSQVCVSLKFNEKVVEKPFSSFIYYVIIYKKMLKTNVVTIYCISIRGESKKDLGGKQVPKVQETSMAVRACAPGNSSFFRL